MTTINETCKCGSKFEAEYDDEGDDYIIIGSQLREFRVQHKICLQPVTMSTVEKS